MVAVFFFLLLNQIWTRATGLLLVDEASAMAAAVCTSLVHFSKEVRDRDSAVPYWLSRNFHPPQDFGRQETALFDRWIRPQSTALITTQCLPLPQTQKQRRSKCSVCDTVVGVIACWQPSTGMASGWRHWKCTFHHCIFVIVVCDCLDIVCDNFTLALQLMREIKTRSQHLNSLI